MCLLEKFQVSLSFRRLTKFPSALSPNREGSTLSKLYAQRLRAARGRQDVIAIIQLCLRRRLYLSLEEFQVFSSCQSSIEVQLLTSEKSMKVRAAILLPYYTAFLFASSLHPHNEKTRIQISSLSHTIKTNEIHPITTAFPFHEIDTSTRIARSSLPSPITSSLFGARRIIPEERCHSYISVYNRGVSSLPFFCIVRFRNSVTRQPNSRPMLGGQHNSNLTRANGGERKRTNETEERRRTGLPSQCKGTARH